MLNLEDFKSVQPAQLDLTDDVKGPRAVTATKEFYQQASKQKLHNGGQLPPASSTFRRRRDDHFVYVFYKNDTGLTRQVDTWEYISFDEKNKHNIPVVLGEPLTILLRPGHYTDTDFARLPDLSRLPWVEIIGDCEDASQVQLSVDFIHDSEFYDEHAIFQDYHHLRLCNLHVRGAMGGAGLSRAACLELDGVDIQDELRSDECPADGWVSASRLLVLRDCHFVSMTTVVNCTPNIYIIHCRFHHCGQHEDFEIHDPFYRAPLIEISRAHNVMLCHCVSEENNLSHLLHRQVPLREQLSTEQMEMLFRLVPGSDAAAARARMDRDKNVEDGLTVLHNNSIQQICCRSCDTTAQPYIREAGLHCLPNQQKTDDALQLHLIHDLLREYEERQRSSPTTVPDSAPAVMKQCVTRWGLLPPYDMGVDWQAYWDLRSKTEAKVPHIEGHEDEYFDEDSMDDDDDDEDDDGDEDEEEEKPESARFLKRIKQQVSHELRTINWEPETHFHFSPCFKERVFTLLLCIQRLAHTHPEQTVWSAIPFDVLRLIFREMAGSFPGDLYLNSLYVKGGHASYEEVGDPRSYSLNGYIFGLTGNGLALRYCYDFHYRYRTCFLEQWATLGMGLRNPGHTEKGFELFAKGEAEMNVLEFRFFSSEESLWELARLLLGPNSLPAYRFFRLLFFSAGAGMFPDKLDMWPLQYAEKKLEQRLTGYQFMRECPPTKDYRAEFDQVREDMDMRWF